MAGHERFQMSAKELRVIAQHGRAIRMDGNVVPGGHDTSVLRLEWIPVRRDVRVRARKEHEGLRGAGRELSGVWIGSREMPAQRAEWANAALEHERQVRREEIGALDGGDERRERMASRYA